MEVLQNPPSASSFTPLAEHQSRTPQSFYDGPPILHYHSSRCKVVILESDISASPALNTLRGRGSNANGSTGAGAGAAQDSNEEKEIVIEGVDVLVTSDKFLLYRSEVSSGIALPYPLISLHAIQRLRLPEDTQEEVQGLYMQIAKDTPADETGAEEDEEEDSITLTIVPPPTTAAEEDMEVEEDTKPEESATQTLFAAVSACSNLHPDPLAQGENGDEYGDEDYEDSTEQPGVGGLIMLGANTNGGLPPPVDGSSGWITAENMHQYFDEEGNWIADSEPPASMSLPGLGPGAGNVHNREDNEQVSNGDGAGAGEENGDGETKWRRTD